MVAAHPHRKGVRPAVTHKTLGLLFQFGLFLVALIGLVVTLTKKK
ncbi:putative holin-like toxin [Brevibacillus formosus]